MKAGHCCTNPVGEEVYLGTDGPWSDDPFDKNQTAKIEDFRRHEKANIATVNFDICLLKLDRPAILSSRIFPICLGIW